MQTCKAKNWAKNGKILTSFLALQLESSYWLLAQIVETGCLGRRGYYRSTRADPPATSFSTSATVAMVVSPGVVIARAP